MITTTLKDLMLEAAPEIAHKIDTGIPIRVYNGPGKEVTIVSVYLSDGEIILDVVEDDDEDCTVKT